MVKPPAIYYSSAEVMKSIPSKVGNVSSARSEGGFASSAPSTPTPSRKFKSLKHLSSTVGAQDAVFGDLVDTARVVALEDSLRVSN